MIVKHLYYFTRFWMGLILSIVLPILFVLLSLLIIKFDNTETTTVRNLTLVLPDLAEESSNITSFGLSLDRIFLFILEYVCRFFFFLSHSLFFFLFLTSSLPLSSHACILHALFVFSFILFLPLSPFSLTG